MKTIQQFLEESEKAWDEKFVEYPDLWRVVFNEEELTQISPSKVKSAHLADLIILTEMYVGMVEAMQVSPRLPYDRGNNEDYLRTVGHDGALDKVATSLTECLQT